MEMENENVVNSAIEYVTTVQQTKMPYRVSPPVLPLTEQDRRRYAVRHIGAVHHVLVLHLHQRPREVDDALDTRDCRQSEQDICVSALYRVLLTSAQVWHVVTRDKSQIPLR